MRLAKEYAIPPNADGTAASERMQVRMHREMKADLDAIPASEGGAGHFVREAIRERFERLEVGEAYEQACRLLDEDEAFPLDDSRHFMDCRTCGEPFDMRDLDQVIAHEHDGPHEVTGIVGERLK